MTENDAFLQALLSQMVKIKYFFQASIPQIMQLLDQLHSGQQQLLQVGIIETKYIPPIQQNIFI